MHILWRVYYGCKRIGERQQLIRLKTRHGTATQSRHVHNCCRVLRVAAMGHCAICLGYTIDPLTVRQIGKAAISS